MHAVLQLMNRLRLPLTVRACCCHLFLFQHPLLLPLHAPFPLQLQLSLRLLHIVTCLLHLLHQLRLLRLLFCRRLYRLFLLCSLECLLRLHRLLRLLHLRRLQCPELDLLTTYYLRGPRSFCRMPLQELLRFRSVSTRTLSKFIPHPSKLQLLLLLRSLRCLRLCPCFLHSPRVPCRLFP
jgi:hypothetical protein